MKSDHTNIKSIVAAIEKMHTSVCGIISNLENIHGGGGLSAKESAEVASLKPRMEAASAAIGKVAKTYATVSNQTNLLAITLALEAHIADGTDGRIGAIATEVNTVSRSLGHVGALIIVLADAIEAQSQATKNLADCFTAAAGHPKV